MWHNCTHRYAYDGLARVAGSTVSFGGGGSTTYAYAYDDAGNRTGVTVNGVLVQSHTYDNADQVVGWTYDDAGNLLDDGTRTYTWDPLHRLASTSDGTTTIDYAYDGDNNLAGQFDGSVGINYLLDTQGGLAERFGAVTLPIVSGSPSTAWYDRGFGGELARETSGTSANLTWFLPDRLGSVRAEYDDTGTTGLRLDYDPFGQPEAGTGLGSPADYGFAGEPRDPATGLVQLRARWYQPGTGLFASRDPFLGDVNTPQSFGTYERPSQWLRSVRLVL